MGAYAFTAPRSSQSALTAGGLRGPALPPHLSHEPRSSPAKIANM
ncbi:hypothetical protein STRIP9103_05895 [Streptomyces ipomoeae 91-03]|uniref:Uncharacterized protein n=1 Tax=Streptomyces ipomoeae 91-03 TaxID=698759 RepID=L1L080_9ACTN|nr:hypothetical protein STRIP9103_05895 [Streptomyces ipomoeae 91-03]